MLQFLVQMGKAKCRVLNTRIDNQFSNKYPSLTIIYKSCGENDTNTLAPTCDLRIDEV